LKVTNSTTKDFSNSEKDEISNKELKITMIRMINEIKEDIYKHVIEFKEDTNKQLNEIRQIMKDMKKEFNKDIEIKKSN
jgi:hypothetical protein